MDETKFRIIIIIIIIIIITNWYSIFRSEDTEALEECSYRTMKNG